MLATLYRSVLVGASAFGLAFAAPLMAHDRFEDATSIHVKVNEMVEAIAERNAVAFAELLTVSEDASLWDLEHRYDGALAVQAWMTGLLQLVPKEATYSASTPRVILRPDGDDDAAWVASSWQWAAWEGHATALMKREEGEWRFYRVDFFGVKLLLPDADMDPTWAAGAIGASEATLQAAAGALANRDMQTLASLARPSFYLIDEDGMPVADPMQAVLDSPAGGALEAFEPATALMYIDATAGLALAYNVDAPDDSLRLLLDMDDAGWGLAAGTLGVYDFPEWLDVSPRQRALTTWGHLRRAR